MNIVSKRRFSLYLNIRRLRKGPGKFFMGVLESPGKVLNFVVSKRVGTLFIRVKHFGASSYVESKCKCTETTVI